MVSGIPQICCLGFVNESAVFGFKGWLQLTITSSWPPLLCAFFQSYLANEWGGAVALSMGD